MTAKRSPLDFIINDSTARSDKQKAREYAATRTAGQHAASTKGDHWRHVWGARLERRLHKGFIAQPIFFSNDRRRVKKACGDLKKAVNPALCMSHTTYGEACSRIGSSKRERRRGGENILTGLIQWHFGVIQISAHLGPNESTQPLF